MRPPIRVRAGRARRPAPRPRGAPPEPRPGTSASRSRPLGQARAPAAELSRAPRSPRNPGSESAGAAPPSVNLPAKCNHANCLLPDFPCHSPERRAAGLPGVPCGGNRRRRHRPGIRQGGRECRARGGPADADRPARGRPAGPASRTGGRRGARGADRVHTYLPPPLPAPPARPGCPDRRAPRDRGRSGDPSAGGRRPPRARPAPIGGRRAIAAGFGAFSARGRPGTALRPDA